MRDFKVFISYSQHDGREYAERLNELIRRVFSDIRIFWAKQLTAGEGLWDSLHEEVRHCDVFLYLISDSSIEIPSDCIRAYSWARFYGKKIVPSILPTYSGNPTHIPGFPELSELLHIDLRNGVENSIEELAKLYGTLYDSIIKASPITQFHRKEMMLLYQILGKLSDDQDRDELGRDVYQQGYELEYQTYPRIEGSVSESTCIEVIDILSMMDALQYAWTEFTDAERNDIKEATTDNVEYLVNNVGFWVNEEAEHFSYMKFLNDSGRFTHLKYAFNNGNSHMTNLPRYRAMLREYSRIKFDEAYAYFSERHLLSVGETKEILQADRYSPSHPL